MIPSPNGWDALWMLWRMTRGPVLAALAVGGAAILAWWVLR